MNNSSGSPTHIPRFVKYGVLFSKYTVLLLSIRKGNVFLNAKYSFLFIFKYIINIYIIEIKNYVINNLIPVNIQLTPIRIRNIPVFIPE